MDAPAGTRASTLPSQGQLLDAFDPGEMPVPTALNPEQPPPRRARPRPQALRLDRQSRPHHRETRSWVALLIAAVRRRRTARPSATAGRGPTERTEQPLPTKVGAAVVSPMGSTSDLLTRMIWSCSPTTPRARSVGRAEPGRVGFLKTTRSKPERTRRGGRRPHDADRRTTAPAKFVQPLQETARIKKVTSTPGQLIILGSTNGSNIAASIDMFHRD